MELIRLSLIHTHFCKCEIRKLFSFYFILNRCVDIGKFEMIGSNERTCIHSEWTGVKPVCNGLNQENDYASKEEFLNDKLWIDLILNLQWKKIPQSCSDIKMDQ